MESTIVNRKRMKSKCEYDENEMAHKKSLKQVKSRRSFFFYSGLLGVLCFLLVAYQLSYSSYQINTVDRIVHNFGLHTNMYAVIIDAGSTGSRILATSFYKSSFDGGLKLSDDLFVQNKPGLSSFADNPEKGAEKIAELIEKAKLFVPKSEWNRTPIALRATAGLRLLPIEKADALLAEVRKVIKASPFMSIKDTVSIMDGKDEGLYSWFTVNFFLDKLNDANKKSVMTLDLGGGSVQITYIPKPYSPYSNQDTKFLYPVTIMQNKVNMYSYSYLGLGLMAARNKVFLAENSETSTDIKSSCVHSSIKNQEWSYGGTSYLISGKSSNGDIFNKCSSLVKVAVKEENVDKIPDSLDREIVAFSYFFDRATDCNLLGSNDESGIFNIKDFLKKAEEYCNNPRNRPFLCFDLTFIAYLLKDGFGLKTETPIQLIDTVDGHEISWALGAAYSILNDKL